MHAIASLAFVYQHERQRGTCIRNEKGGGLRAAGQLNEIGETLSSRNTLLSKITMRKRCYWRASKTGLNKSEKPSLTPLVFATVHPG